ncbi:MAG TPA: PPE domain-containing protein [Actinophytocola sp.]|jgi:uncharacterized protein YukE|uniref:PPE domain-containing protein n=1 Tax=Actinophytocola sp. TaxID=1872138 RepID=UPI002F932FBA
MNHAPDDYNRDRMHKTFGEKHHLTDEQKAERHHHTTTKRKNRLPGHFGKANWKVYQHYELYNMIMKAKPHQMYVRAEKWKDLSGKIENTTAEIQSIMEQALGVWQGPASVSAGASTTRLMQWASDASHTAGTVAANMSQYTDAVQQAQRNMPPPGFATAEERFRDGYTVMTTGGPADAIMLKALTTDALVSHQEARARKEEAVAVMEAYEAESKDVHTRMPHFTDSDGTKPQQAWVPPASPGGVSDGGGGAGFGPGSAGFPPAGSGVSGSSPSGNGSTSAQGFVDPFAPGGTGPGGNGLNGPTSFGGGPGSLNGGADALRGGSGFGTGFPGGAAAAGGAGAAAEMGAGALAARGAGGVLGAGPGGVVPGAAGARGGAGAFGGMPLGHGANGEEDGEHTNKYDEGLDLFDDLPPAYPPVFGA